MNSNMNPTTRTSAPGSQSCQQLPYYRKLPDSLTSHQALELSVNMHELTSQAIKPHLADQPHYVAIERILGTIHVRNLELAEAQTRRRYKKPGEMRESGQDLDPNQKPKRPSIAQRKTALHRQRALTMSRFRQFVSLHQATAPSDTYKQAANQLHALVFNRMPRFERLSYAESSQEFRHLFRNIEKTPGAATAIELLNLSELFRQLKMEDTEFNELRSEHTRLEALREATSKLVPATKALRHHLGILLTMLHFEVENGDARLAPLLAQLHELIDKAAIVAKGRQTRKRNMKSKESQSPETPEDPENPEAPEDPETSASPENQETPKTAENTEKPEYPEMADANSPVRRPEDPEGLKDPAPPEVPEDQTQSLCPNPPCQSSCKALTAPIPLDSSASSAKQPAGR